MRSLLQVVLILLLKILLIAALIKHFMKQTESQSLSVRLIRMSNKAVNSWKFTESQDSRCGRQNNGIPKMHMC